MSNPPLRWTEPEEPPSDIELIMAGLSVMLALASAQATQPDMKEAAEIMAMRLHERATQLVKTRIGPTGKLDG